jgi:hypothetical protein
VDVDTGTYLFPGNSPAGVACWARADLMSGPHVEALDRRHAAEEDHLGVMWGSAPADLSSAGWALVTSGDGDPAVRRHCNPCGTCGVPEPGTDTVS